MIENFLSGINCIIDNKIIKPNVIPPAPVNPYIIFVDPIVKQICVENWGSDGEITYEQAAAVTDLGDSFNYWSENPPTEQITSFDEFQYFTGLTNIGDSAFANAGQLTSIILPNSLVSIGGGAFYSCVSLPSITIPDSVTFIGAGAFEETPFYLNMPDGDVYINNIYYRYKGNMAPNTSISILEGTTMISGAAFLTDTREPQTNLTSIYIPESVTFIEGGAFNNCSSLVSVELPSSVTSIESSLFADCSSLVSVVIPSSVTFIDRAAFYNCSSLLDINIPESQTFISDMTFEGCTSLTSIVIPGLVTSIGNNAFYGCTSLTAVYVDSTVPPTLGSNVFLEAPITSIFVPAESIDTYKTAPYWSDYASIIKAQILPTTPITFADPVVKQICVENWGSNGEITYEQAAAVTDLNSFFRSSSIKTFEELQYFTSLTSLSNYAFEECRDLTSIIIPNSVTSIGDYAFSNCRILPLISIPNSVTSIGVSAFSDCLGLTSFIIPNLVTVIQGSTFNYCSGLTSIEVPALVNIIESYAFAYCNGLDSIFCKNIVPPTLQGDVFKYCESLSDIFVPAESVDAYKTAEGWSNYANIILEELPPPR